MKKELSFPYPFSGFERMNFINCFAGFYMFLEGYDGTEDCYCGGSLAICTSCGDCRASIGKKQEELFFYWGTLTGGNSERRSFDGQKDLNVNDTDGQIDMAMRLAGYRYEKISSGFWDAVVASIDAGLPVLARVKDTGEGTFRVIHGYEDGAYLSPHPGNAQNPPCTAPTCDEIECLYIATGRETPEIGLKAALQKITEVMEYNQQQGTWDDYLRHLGPWVELDDFAPDFLDAEKNRFKRVQDVMWFTFNSHYFGQAFCRELYHRTENAALRSIYAKIKTVYGDTHDLCWVLIALYDRVDWSRSGNWRGLRGVVFMVVNALMENDRRVLALVRQANELA